MISKELLKKFKSTEEYKDNYDLVRSFNINLPEKVKQERQESFFAFMFVLVWDITAGIVAKEINSYGENITLEQQEKIFEKVDSFEKVLEIVRSGELDNSQDDIRNYVIFKLKPLIIKEGTHAHSIQKNWGEILKMLRDSYMNLKMFVTFNN